MDASTREFVRQRASHRCEYCRLPETAVPFFAFHVEHVRASQHRGGDEAENLALACPYCNRFKGPNLSAIDPERPARSCRFSIRRRNPGRSILHLWAARLSVARWSVGQLPICSTNV